VANYQSIVISKTPWGVLSVLSLSASIHFPCSFWVPRASWCQLWTARLDQHPDLNHMVSDPLNRTEEQNM